jgi:hypothetical protein
MVVIVNSVLWNLIVFFVKHERHRSFSGAQSSLMVKVFVSVFLNMSLILFLVNYNGIIFSGAYSDFNRNWYGVVASTLCLNLFFNVFSCAAFYIVFAFLARMGRMSCCTRKARHQAELIRAYENPDFEVAAQYAQLLATVFSTLVYSSGLPVLYFFATVYMFVTYWVDKWVLLHCSKRPPIYDARMPKQALSLLLWAGPLHLFSAMFMLSNACTSPSKALGGSISDLANQADSSMSSNSFSDRIGRESSWFFFVALIVVVSCLVLWLLCWVLWDITGLGSFVRLLMACCGGDSRVSPDAGDDEEGQEPKGMLSFVQEKERIDRVSPPASFRMIANPACAEIAAALESIATSRPQS